MNVPLSAVIITKNEEARIAATLRALQWCDEIIVVDSGSTDNTIHICREMGCQVQFHAFENYGRQKQYAVSLARNNWVLSVDADEVVTQELAREIQALPLNDSNPLKGYKIKRCHVFMGKVLRFGGEYNKPFLRLFDKRDGQFNDAVVHEEVILKGRSGTLQHQLLHYSYENLHDYFTKFNQYTTLAAQKMADKKAKSKMYIRLKFILTFLHLYLIRGLILDGYNGFVWAMVSSFYPFVKYAKHRELKSKQPI